MIKELVQLVMPKQLGVVGTVLAIGSTVGKVIVGRKQDKDINQAQAKQQATEKAIRGEQAVRERTRQVRQSAQASAQAEAAGLATGVEGGSGAKTAQTSIANDLTSNLNTLDFNLASGDAVSLAKQNVMNAGRPNAFQNFNNALSPLILGNVAGINEAGSDILDSLFD